MKNLKSFCFILFLLTFANLVRAASDTGIKVDLKTYQNRELISDFTAEDCPNNPRGLQHIQGNLYRHTTGAGLAVHSGLVLITKEGALIIDPAMTCTSTWLKDEIKNKFNA